MPEPKRAKMVEEVIDHLITEGQLQPEHRDEMVETLDSELRRSSRRMLRTIAQDAVAIAAIG